MAIETYKVKARPTVTAFAYGRVWYAGVEDPKYQSTLFFSQVVQGKNSLARCYQEADPTSENINSLIDSDGGTLKIPEVGEIYGLRQIGQVLTILADNGVWAILPSEGGFSPLGFVILKVSEIGALGKEAIAEVEGTVCYISDNGIYQITPSEEGANLISASITEDKIDTYVRSISPLLKGSPTLTYDRHAKKLYAAFGGSDNRKKLVLIFSLKAGAWYPHSLPTTLDETNRFFAALPIFSPRYSPSSGLVFLSMYVKRNDSDFSRIFFASYNDYSFKDFSTIDVEAYLETPPITLDNPQFNKQATYVTTYFVKTESGYEEIDGALFYTNPSSCLLQAKWDWHVTDKGNRWGAKQQVYRFRREYFPENAEDTFDTGETIITTKTKVRGKGKALSLRFEAEAGKDLQLVGFSVPMTMNGEY